MDRNSINMKISQYLLSKTSYSLTGNSITDAQRVLMSRTIRSKVIIGLGGKRKVTFIRSAGENVNATGYSVCGN